MAIRYLLLAALVATCYCQDFCVFKAPEKEIDWSLVRETHIYVIGVVL